MPSPVNLMFGDWNSRPSLIDTCNLDRVAIHHVAGDVSVLDQTRRRGAHWAKITRPIGSREGWIKAFLRPNHWTPDGDEPVTSTVHPVVAGTAGAFVTTLSWIPCDPERKRPQHAGARGGNACGSGQPEPDPRRRALGKSEVPHFQANDVTGHELRDWCEG